MTDYADWLASKSRLTSHTSVAHGPLADHLYPHQRDLTAWALRRGRAAVFADTGLGKTAIQIEWARHVAAHGRVLILAPLAVAEQTVREAARFGVDVRYRREDDGSPIVIANYEMLSHFDPRAFVGIVLDESSILKSFTGATRNLIIESFGATPYRLACTATPAPNDFTELGNHSEFLGVMSRVEMLSEYFVHDGGSTSDWRIKGHAVEPFWRWVCSWGAMLKRPSDLGHDDGAFALPPLRMHEHVVKVATDAAWSEGMLFAPEAKTLSDQRATRRMTRGERIEVAVDLANRPGATIVWCELNAEQDELAAAFGDRVFSVQGSDEPEDKVDAIRRWLAADRPIMISKPSIMGWGLNFQHCARVVFVGASHSYEQTYQAIRRCWRFGQASPVDVHVIRAETEQSVVANYRRKEADAERMADEMVSRMRDTMRAEISSAGRQWNDYNPRIGMVVPEWLATV